VELWIGGGGISTDLDGDPEAIRLRGLAERVGVADRVRLLGQVARAEVPGLLRSARVVTATPWYESFGLVPLEAMACGAPVLASAVGGHLDTVVDGVTGRLVPPGRADLVAVSLNRLLDDPVQLDAFGVAGADRARSRYSWQRIAADTVRVYHAATGTPMPEENVGAPFVEPAR
jgi:glycosyltransferase involved in cell wall biosynthesis